jgi:3' exoribonuclease, RNase T-like
MKYFLDTEFIENPGTIELISLGITCEDGRKLYLVNLEADLSKANDWVRKNVLQQMPEYDPKYPDVFRNDTPFLQTRYKIKNEILKFVDGTTPQFYGYFADYDWVVFCWIFGTMMDLPEGFPMYCMDLKQMMIERGLTKEWKQANCPDPEGEHNALVDAEWNLKLYNEILNVK